MARNVQNMSRKFLKESTIMKIHYITGLAALLTVAVHVMMRVVVPFSISLEYENVVANYQNILYALLLESVLILISIHGFNGLRVMLLELRQNATWEKFVTLFTLIAMLAVIGYGTRTIIVVSGQSL
ncbi:MAG TPA: succinate dehydrogenase [Nitrososphaeraceae archaeon]|nr:succinate dehydrogenase [Nitrososphaeraceae archaeon]